MEYNFREGAVLLVDKPLEWTSFDVVNKIRYALKKALGIKKIKVGHAGTLDPLATGLLIICTGKFTKKINTYQGMYKVYDGTIKIGAKTPSYDAETEVEQTFPIDHITESILYDNLKHFTGTIEQLPPIFSAIKVDGQPLYKKARKGEKVKVSARTVTIHDFVITKINLPYIDFLIKCSKGTYIRSLAHDFGEKLNNGAYLTKLRRTYIGEHSLDNAWNLDELIAYIHDSYTAET
ncbi:MAG: tRNA pseudouridine(55) synthase TruB [Saprospiraceae bacterium]|nr:tRNA pseudouridine(55) synthase TruB [Saprospiraceae bacterium]